MNAIRIKTHVDSETLRLPELKALIGKDVEIIFLDESRVALEVSKKSKSKKVKTGWFTRNFGSGWPDDKDDGFEAALEKWRKEETFRELPE